MGVPAKEELEAALHEARLMREQGTDPHHVAKALLNFHYRYQLMEKVVDAARHYMHSGPRAPRARNAGARHRSSRAGLPTRGP